LPIPAQKKCGACKFLPDFKPLICQQNGSEKKKTDNPCEEYAPKIKYTTSIDVDNSNEMNQTGRLEAKITEAQEERAKSLEDIITLNELIIKMIKALNQRIEEAPRGSAQRKMFQRQYEIFVGLFQSFSEDETYEKAVKRILTAFGVTKKTVQRDISEIENFLKKNVPGL
jgi:hypothetical protein